MRPVTRDISAIQLEHVEVTFGTRLILSYIDLSVKHGEFVCIVGPSGCGKTTMLRLIAGLLDARDGRVMIDGVAVRGPSPRVAMVFPDYERALLPWRTVYGNVSLALEARGIEPAQHAERVKVLLEKVGLADRAGAHPAKLSGDQQQRLQIARCLAQDSAVLLMDEPFGAFDAMTRQALQNELFGIVGGGVTVLFATHDLEEALYLGDRVIALHGNPGRVARSVDVPLPRPRDQLSTRENPDFLRLRRELFTVMEESRT